ncbi:unnamed protein product [Phytophthora fragariaefolia]|uniref:Unnamed protein product n=1 Tax=Phytophthora fragariaefolia TaxID=1490495 RepID=A0A9W6XUP1_9STRA|nr:unnamed protein product [Phytophthora fragariaefolia]
MEGSGGNGNGNIRGQANFTVASSVHSHEQQGPALKQQNRDVSLAPNPSLKVLKSNQKPVYNAEQWISGLYVPDGSLGETESDGGVGTLYRRKPSPLGAILTQLEPGELELPLAEQKPPPRFRTT